MSIIIWTLIFFISLAILIKSSEVFTRASIKVGRQWKLPPFFTGFTLLSLGTALPELTTSLFATAQGYSSMVSGVVLGSNIANILLIGGGIILLGKGLTMKDSAQTEWPFLLVSMVLFIVTIYDGVFSRIEGLLLLIAYVLYVLHQHQNNRPNFLERIEQLMPRKALENGHWFLWLLSLVGLSFGAYFTVKSLVEIASFTGLNSATLSLSVLAIGTALPEFFVGLRSIREKNSGLFLGTLFGSILFTTTVGMGIPSFIAPLMIPEEVIVLGIPFLLIATLLFASSRFQTKIYSLEGGLYGLLYLVFIGQLFNIL